MAAGVAVAAFAAAVPLAIAICAESGIRCDVVVVVAAVAAFAAVPLAIAICAESGIRCDVVVVVAAGVAVAAFCCCT